LPDFNGRFKADIRYIRTQNLDPLQNFEIVEISTEVEIEQKEEFLIIRDFSVDDPPEGFRLGTVFEDVSVTKCRTNDGKYRTKIKPNGKLYVRTADSSDTGTILALVTKVDDHNRVIKFGGSNNSGGLQADNPSQFIATSTSTYHRID